MALWQHQIRARLAYALILAVILVAGLPIPARAEEIPRVIRYNRDVNAYQWEVVSWSDGKSVCTVYVEEKGSPSDKAIQYTCGKGIYDTWKTTPPCTIVNGKAKNCTGYYLRNLGMSLATISEPVEYPPARVSIEWLSCVPWHWCDGRPSLKFVGFEPLGDYKVTEVHVLIQEREKVCRGSSCTLRMPLTNEEGMQIEYWAKSSYGDESEHRIVQLRNVRPSGQTGRYRLELLSEDWTNYAPSGVGLWELFPAVDDPTRTVFEQVSGPQGLATANPFLYLAGNLIRKGIVNGRDCPSYGLEANGTANACGDQITAETVAAWQNQYDAAIYKAAMTYHVPPRVLKAIIARETQFWPVNPDPLEYGFGKITENGADLLLTWNIDYYLELCKPIFGEIKCSSGYPNLIPGDRAILRGRTLAAVGTDQEFNLLAATLRASLLQTDQMMRNVTGRSPAAVATYEDMWALTIANYHGGSGCVGTAMRTTKDSSMAMTWDNIGSKLLGDCQGAIPYVSDVIALANSKTILK